MLRSCEQLEFQMPGHLGVLSKTASPPQDWEFLDSFTSIFDSIFLYLFPDFWPFWTFHKWFQKINFQGFEVQVVHQNSRRIWCWTWIILPQAPPTATKIVGCCDWCFWQTLDRQGAVHCELVAGCTYQGRRNLFLIWTLRKQDQQKQGVCMFLLAGLLPSHKCDRLWYAAPLWSGGFLHLHTGRCYATDVSCTCTHVDATQLMFLALSMLRMGCKVYRGGVWGGGVFVFGWVGGGGWGWGGWDVNVRCTCTHLDATQLIVVTCTCTHVDATQLMFLALAHMSMLRNWCFLHSQCYAWAVRFTGCVCGGVGWVGC